jgi:hypothetical protein
MKTNVRWMVLGLWLVTATPTAQAAESAEVPLIHHAPPRLFPGQAAYPLAARIGDGWSGREMQALVRVRGEKSYETVRFLRREGGVWVASVPGRFVRPPGLEYYLRTIEADEKLVPRFGSAEEPHMVVVDPSSEQMSHRSRLDRHDGHRAVFKATLSHQSMGARRQSFEEAKPLSALKLFPDSFNSADLSVTYFALRDELYSISFGYGMMGGIMGTSTPDISAYEVENSALPSVDKPLRPGVYYGFGKVYWEFYEYFGLEPMVIMGASYDGFEVGGGLLARFGALTGTHFDISLQGITSVGLRFITEFEWATLEHTRMSLKHEMTDYPVGGGMASIPSYNLTLLLGEWELSGSIGYGLRKGHEEGGLCAGAGLAFKL